MAMPGTTAADPSLPGDSGLARNHWLALAAPVFGLMIVGLDSTIPTVALPALATELEATTTELQWFTDGTASPLTAGAQ